VYEISFVKLLNIYYASTIVLKISIEEWTRFLYFILISSIFCNDNYKSMNFNIVVLRNHFSVYSNARRLAKTLIQCLKLPMEYHNNYLEYIVQRDGWNVASLNRYREFRKLLDHPMRLKFFKRQIWITRLKFHSLEDILDLI
jgi:hypothetical protein